MVNYFKANFLLSLLILLYSVGHKKDEMVTEGETERKLFCGTSKEKRKAKNLKTAGKHLSLFFRIISVLLDKLWKKYTISSAAVLLSVYTKYTTCNRIFCA